MLKKIFLILFCFILSQGQAVSGQMLDNVVALVNDDVITESELNEQVRVLKKQLQAKGTALPPEEVLRKQVLQHMIDVALQMQLAKNNHLDVDNKELNETIAKIAKDNHFTVTELRKELSKKGIEWQNYRDNIKKEIIISRLQQRAIANDIVITNEQVDEFLKTSKLTQKKQQTYHLKNIVIPLPEEPTSVQVKKAYEKAQSVLKTLKSGESFEKVAISESSGEYALEGGDLGERHLAELPEIFANKVMHMQVGEVSSPIRTGNGYQIIKLVSMGGNDKKHFVNKTHVRHILLAQDARLTEPEAKKQINNIYQQIKAGKDFASLAKQYSVDSASAAKGGDLGWVTSDELVPAFASVMDTLPLNKISKPVKSQFGWHIIEVMGRKKVDDSEAYEKQEIRRLLHQRKFTEAVQNWQQHIRADAFVQVVEKSLA